ncbi:MAG: Fe-S cluster assembly protein SufD [Beijerinckiaceae bacterium]|nr:Fe-S cluster assembly protein SufD [Beijerinckiaceae bacterium]
MSIVTPLKTAAEQALSAQFSAAKAELPGALPVRKLREDAFAGFEAKGLPHRRLESWRYTDLRGLLREAKPLADKASVTPAVTACLAELAFEGVRLVLIDGAFSADLSTLDAVPPGVTIQPLSEALVSTREDLIRILAGPGIAQIDTGLMLNTALMRDGVFIEIAEGTELAQPIAIVSLASGEDERAIFHRSVVVAGKGVKATIVEIGEGVGPHASQVNGAIVFETGDESDVQHLRIVSRAVPETVQVQTLMATVGANAKFESFALVCEAATLRQQYFVEYAGEHSEIGLRGVNLLGGQEHSDVTLVMDHAVPHGVSREMFKNIIGGEATGVFQGKVIVRKYAQKTDGGMKSNTLLLNDGATMFNKPELEIFADDVVCGHGATVAQMDGEQLFYLMARGLPRPQAEALVLQAFAGEAVEFVQDESLRGMVMGRIESWLAKRDGSSLASTV